MEGGWLTDRSRGLNTLFHQAGLGTARYGSTNRLLKDGRSRKGPPRAIKPEGVLQ